MPEPGRPARRPASPIVLALRLALEEIAERRVVERAERRAKLTVVGREERLGVILRTRTWKGGSSYEVTASPEQVVERLPLPGEEIELGEMGRVRVMSAYHMSSAGQGAGWPLPTERLWRLVVQTRDIGPGFENL